MIDSQGYRANVGIILCNKQRRLFWARRVGQNAWQFPQGGIREHETPEQAMYRELFEETGLQPEHDEIIGIPHQHTEMVQVRPVLVEHVEGDVGQQWRHRAADNLANWPR